MDLVPVTTGGVDEPVEEVSEVLTYTGDTSHSSIVVAVSESAPVHDDDVAVLNCEECRCDERVHGSVAVVVQPVNDYVQGSISVVIGSRN